MTITDEMVERAAKALTEAFSIDLLDPKDVALVALEAALRGRITPMTYDIVAPDEIAALIAETERALREVPQDILRRNLIALRALAQDNERLKNGLSIDDAEFGMREHLTPNQMLERIRELEVAFAKISDETKSNVAAIANSHI